MRKLLFMILIIFIISISTITYLFRANDIEKIKNNVSEIPGTKEENKKVDFDSTNVDFDSTFVDETKNENKDDINNIESNSSNKEIKEKQSEFQINNTIENNNNNENKNIKEEKDLTNKKEIINKENIEEGNNNPWDELGITEYDYYNKPMWSWARVDYSIKDFETVEKVQQACIEAGNNMMDEILSYSCTSINSYSGNYLGEMLRIKC